MVLKAHADESDDMLLLEHVVVCFCIGRKMSLLITFYSYIFGDLAEAPAFEAMLAFRMVVACLYSFQVMMMLIQVRALLLALPASAFVFFLTAFPVPP
mmetsp:Transcript_9826/g.14631  ORF Transcript_9826/g.14631 Transcript_9826/m.14631 type:complete len:98 (-) Transcript_9826:308-601(-)